MASLIDPTSPAYGASLSRTDNEGPFNAAIADAVALGNIVAIPPVIAATPWKISGKISIPTASHGLTILGGSRVQSTIQQQTDNTPILEFSGQSHSISLEGLHLGYLNQQTTSNTDSYGVKFTNTASGSQGIYLSSMRNCRISKAYRGIGIAGTGMIACWGWRLDQVWLEDIAQDAVYWASPTSVGMPDNEATNLHITGRNGSAAGYAWQSVAANWFINGMEVDQWQDRLIIVSGGRPVSIRGFHCESHTVTEANSRLFETANDNLRMEDVDLASWTVNATGTLTIYVVNTGGSLEVDGFKPGTLTLTAGAVQFMNAASGLPATVKRYTPDSNISFGTVAGVRHFEAVGSSIQAFADGDTSPSVLGFSYFSTANSSGTTITTFDNGFPGQEITLIFSDANTTIAETGNIKLSAAFTSTADDTMKLIYDGTNWYEVSRSVN